MNIGIGLVLKEASILMHSFTNLPQCFSELNQGHMRLGCVADCCTALVQSDRPITFSTHTLIFLKKSGEHGSTAHLSRLSSSSAVLLAASVVSASAATSVKRFFLSKIKMENLRAPAHPPPAQFSSNDTTSVKEEKR